MSTEIDEKVVEMRFDNQHFERNVKTTMSTLDKLTQKLNLSGVSKGFDDLNRASKGVNLTALGTAADFACGRISALSVFGITYFAKLANSAIDTGNKIVRAFTIDPMKTGFAEYETQLNSVQTILANTSSKGTTLDQVNSALDQLNTYADKTIYNFTQMTKNIGTFTAAGVDLETSVKSIQGIANLAAVSGSSATQASTAMYQLSQALAAGRVSLMDWNSVVNAGMGGEVFQNALKRTAKTMGIAVDESESFRESLSTMGGKESWLTAEVLTETLSQFTMSAKEGTAQWEAYKASLKEKGYSDEQAVEILKMANTATDAATKVKTATQLFETLKETAQSGWAQTWEIIIGDFEESKEFFTGLNDTLSSLLSTMSESRNNLLSGSLSSGWEKLIGAGIADEELYKEQIKEVATAHGVAFEQMITDEGSFVKALKKGLESGKISSNMLTESVIKLSDEIRNMSQEEIEAAGYTHEQIKSLDELRAGLVNGSVSMKDFADKITSLSGREKVLGVLTNSLDGLLSIAKPISKAFTEIFPPVTSEQLKDVIDRVYEVSEKFKISDTSAYRLKRTFRGLFAILDIGKQAIEGVAKGISPLFDGFDGLEINILKTTAEWGDWLVKLSKTTTITEDISDGIEKFIESVSSLGSKIKLPDFKSLAADAKELFGSFKFEFKMPDFSGITEFFNSIGAKASEAKTKITSFFKPLQEQSDKASASMDKIQTAFSETFDFSGISFENFKLDSLLDIFNTGLIGGILIGINKFINTLTNIAKAPEKLVGSLTNIGKSIEKVFNSVTDCVKTFQANIKAKILMEIAKAMAILAASLFVLSIIDPERLLYALGSIMMLMIGLNYTMESTDNLKGESKIVGTMIGFSAAIFILASALTKIGQIDAEQIESSVIAIGALMVGLVVIMERFDKTAPKAISGVGQMVLFALAINVLASAVKKLAGIESGIEQGVAAVAGLLIGLSVFMKASGSAKHMISIGIGMTALGVAMNIFAFAIKQIADLSPDKLKIGLIGFAGALTAVTIALNLLPKNTAFLGFGLAKVAAALLVLAEVMNVMGGMSVEQLQTSILALGLSLGLLAVALNLMDGTMKGSAALLIASVALSTLVPVLLALGAMSWKAIVAGLVAIAGTLAVIGITGSLLAPVIPAILALSGAVALLGISFISIGTGMTLFAAGLTALVAIGATGAASLVAALSIAATGIASIIPMIASSLGKGVVSFASAISDGASVLGAAFVSVIMSILDSAEATIPTMAESMFSIFSQLLTTFTTYTPQIVDTVMTFLIDILNNTAGRLPELIQAGTNLVMAFFSGVMDALSTVDPAVLSNGLIATGVLAAFMTAMAAIALLTPAAILGVAGVGIVIGELALVLAAVGALAQMPGLQWLVEESSGFMQAIGKSIGSFVGGLVGGFGEGVSSSLPQIGNDLAAFMTNAQPFIDGAKSMDTTVLEGVQNLAEVILLLTAADLLNGLTSWLTGGSSLASFGAELAAFGPSMAEYAASVQGIDANAVVASANAAKSLAEMANNLPNSGGVAGWLAGENSLSAFAEELSEFGPKLKEYADSVTGLDAGVVENSANAAKSLSEMASNLPNSGGVVGWFTGENSLSVFAEELSEFGPKLKEYADSVTGLDSTVVENSANAAKALSEMAANLPNSGGVVSWFTGDNTLSAFADELVLFGPKFKEYADSVSGVDGDTILRSANAAKALSELASNLPNSGGVASVVVGDNKLSSFGEELVPFGESLKNYYAQIAEINVANLSRSTAEFNQLVKMAQGMSGTDFGSMGAFGVSLGQLGSTGVNSFIAAFENSSAVVNLAGQDMMNTFVYGLDYKSSSIGMSFVKSLTNTIVTIKANYPNFYNAGIYLVEGFIAGVDSKTEQAIQAATALGEASLGALNAALDEHSPSRESYKSGANFVLGFVNAISELSSKARTSSIKMGDEAKKGLTEALSMAMETVDKEMDTQPTIRPVLDLSNVETGASRLNTLFAHNQASVISYGRAAAYNNKYSQPSMSAALDAASSKYADMIVNAMNKSSTPVNVNVVLEGNAAGVFELVRVENDKMVRATGWNPLAQKRK